MNNEEKTGDMDIDSSIDEMERIAEEIEKDLEGKGIKLLFSWSLDIQGSPIRRMLMYQQKKLDQLREELYKELAEAGVLPRKDVPAAETAPDRG